MSGRIRVGVIGVGWGSIVQVPAFRMLPQCEVVAICSRRQESVEKAGAELGIADVSTDWESFVRRGDLDLISVCTPVDLHADQIIAAAQEGKHVLCEKPQALTARDAERMLEAASAAGIAHAVCFENRYEPPRLAIWERVLEGALGTPYLIRAHSSANYWHPARGLQSEWMYRLEEGGGYLMAMASHDIDYLLCLFGDVNEVCAEVRSTIPSRIRADGSTFEVDADDTSALVMRMRSGATAVVTCTAVALGTVRRELEMHGSRATIRMAASLEGGGPEVTITRAGEDSPQMIAASSRVPRGGRELPRRRAAGAIRSMALMLEDWLPALGGGPAPGVPTLLDGLRVQRVIEAARRSAAGGGWVSLPA